MKTIESIIIEFNFNHSDILNQVIKASRVLAELNGVLTTIPNEIILLNTLIFKEAQDSSAVENIITTQEELFQAKHDEKNIKPHTKEVLNYAAAIRQGYGIIAKNERLITANIIKTIQSINSPNHAEFRKQGGTVLKDNKGNKMYTPPQNHKDILDLMDDLLKFINDNEVSSLDPLIKMTIIHHQFESIHPFYDGNGRMGRILNILYLTQQRLLSLPILYLSSYIIEQKEDYYRFLDEVRTKNNWLDWCTWLLKGVEITAKQTINRIKDIRSLMDKYKRKLKSAELNIYSHELINYLFSSPFTTIKELQKGINVSYLTARKYLEILTKNNLLLKIKVKGHNVYYNRQLFSKLTDKGV